MFKRQFTRAGANFKEQKDITYQATTVGNKDFEESSFEEDSSSPGIQPKETKHFRRENSKNSRKHLLD